MNDINKCVDIINNGGVVILPTETVYGIGCSCFNEESIKRLYEIKKRPYNKPISVLVSNIDMINKVAKNISDKEKMVINHFFPGPLTIILEKNDNVPNILTSNGNTIGVRMADNKLINEIIDKVDIPLAVSSANESGMDANINIDNIYEIFKDKVDYYIDGGTSRIGVASTVVRIKDDEVIILREGIITKSDIEKVING